MASLTRLFGSFSSIKGDVLDGAVMAGGALAAVVVTNKALSAAVIPMAGGKTSIQAFLATKVHPALVPVSKLLIGAVAPPILARYLPGGAMTRKALDGAAIGLAVSGWIGLLTQFEATRSLVASAAFAGAGADYAVMNGAQLNVQQIPASGGWRGANVGVEEVSKFGGIGNQPNRYNTILGA